jgi:hypothetical protein
MVVAADDVRDPHVGVVHADAEVVERVPVRTHEGEVVERVGRKLDAAADQVLDDDRLGRHLEADHELLAFTSAAVALVGRNVPTGAGVAIRTSLRLGAFPLGVELLRRLERTEGLALGDEPFGRRAVEVRALRLEVRAFVVLQAEPVERGEDLSGKLVARTLDVRVLDPQDVGALLPPCKEEVVEGRARTADVQEAGRRWREANAGTVGVGQNAAC